MHDAGSQVMNEPKEDLIRKEVMNELPTAIMARGRWRTPSVASSAAMGSERGRRSTTRS